MKHSVCILIYRPVLIIALTLLLIFPFVSYADVVMGNEFYDRNRDKTVPVGRAFSANGPGGYVSMKEAPGSLIELDRYENGSSIMIGSAYLHRGRYWGIQPIGHMYYMPGWVPMDELLMFYASVDFVDEHKNELYGYTGGFDMLLDAEKFYIWKWPGSDQEKIHYDYMYLEDGDIRAKHAYMDHDGREWVYVLLCGGGPYGGMQYGYPAEGWVCIDDPDNGKLPAFNPAPDPVLWSPNEAPDWYGTATQPQQPGNPQQPQQPGIVQIYPGGASFMPIIIAIIIAAAAAAVIIALIFVRKSRASHRIK